MPEQHYNVNVGVLGHVDSGKTSLVAALSTQLSTAALDKHPQSKERGITLDLGFSSFLAPVPPHLAGLGCERLQFTLVDCPGHASLIRTIIGGAQIIDMMLLVVDVTKGIQAQTAECLVVGEIATSRLLVVLNKTDLLPAAQRERLVARAQKMLRQTFAHTKFRSPPMVAVAAKPGGGDGPAAEAVGIETLVQEVLALVPPQPRAVTGSFLMSVDHCFAVKGHGTVLTGTVLQGSARVNDAVELPDLKLQRKIRSMQMFRQPQQLCKQGDRVGVCVTQLDPASVERGWLCAPGSVPTFSGAIAALQKIRFFAGDVRTRQRLHVSVGHATVMAELTCFGLPDGEGRPPAQGGKGFDFDREYLLQEQLYGREGRPTSAAGGGDGSAAPYCGPQWALLRFSQPVTAPQDALVVVSRLDDTSAGASCRLALHGRLVALLDPSAERDMERLRLFKLKRKEGVVDRVLPDGRTAICRGFFKKETDFSAFLGMQVVSGAGIPGTVESSFGKSGKFRVAFREALPPITPESGRVSLTFKRFVHDRDRRRIAQ